MAARAVGTWRSGSFTRFRRVLETFDLPVPAKVRREQGDGHEGSDRRIAGFLRTIITKLSGGRIADACRSRKGVDAFSLRSRRGRESCAAGTRQQPVRLCASCRSSRLDDEHDRPLPFFFFYGDNVTPLAKIRRQGRSSLKIGRMPSFLVTSMGAHADAPPASVDRR